MTSISFDRAAGYYDQTRGLDPAARAAQTRLLAGELAGRGRCLEVGVGTGRIALDLHEAGVEMAGVDLSLPMLRRLAEKAGGRAPFPVAQADATALPFGAGRFGGAVVCHVLHLVPEWTRALDELLRVVGPRAPVLVDLGGGEPGPPKEVRRHFFQAAGAPADLGTRSQLEHLDEEMRARGRAARRLPPLLSRRSSSLRRLIGNLERGIFANCWQLEAADLERAARETERWAQSRYGDLDSPLELELPVRWRAFEPA